MSAKKSPSRKAAPKAAKAAKPAAPTRPPRQRLSAMVREAIDMEKQQTDRQRTVLKQLRSSICKVAGFLQVVNATLRESVNLPAQDGLLEMECDVSHELFAAYKATVALYPKLNLPLHRWDSSDPETW